MNEIEKLEHDYQQAHANYVNEFCRRCGIDEDSWSWITDIGGPVNINEEYFINFSLILKAVNNNATKEKIYQFILN